jgi:predicted amidophosphoribosyltransferase
LIDDIFTTGATVSEASRVLMRSGALDVKVLTLTAGVLDSEWLI